MSLKVLELFGGIGACSKALENLGIDYVIADYVEIDKFAVKSFNAIHNTSFEPQDITRWDKDIEVDLIMHGSPCQDFSTAGKQAGGDKGSGTRSSLMYETLRIVENLKPQYVIWENVKNLISKKHRHNFDAYLEYMESLGYKNYYQVLNAKDYGVPQNRERVFTISILDNTEFVFPKPILLQRHLKDMLDTEVDNKYYLGAAEWILTDKGQECVEKGWATIDGDISQCITARGFNSWNCQYVTDDIMRIGTLDIKRHDMLKRIYSPQGLSPTIPTGESGNSIPKIANNKGIRKLTPKEAWRLMGFNDTDFEKAEKVNSNSQLYKQAGNSIVVSVLEGVLANLLGEQNVKN